VTSCTRQVLNGDVVTSQDMPPGLVTFGIPAITYAGFPIRPKDKLLYKSRSLFSLMAVLALALIWAMLLPGVARAGTITATTSLDNGAGSLRQAIADAADGSTIVFAADYAIYLTNTLVITKPLTIDGSGGIAGGGTLTVQNSTLAGNSAHNDGGGIFMGCTALPQHPCHQ
jgi:hypothetical protein